VPLAILAWIVPRDWVSAGIMLVTLPLVPVFMALVGLAARTRTERRWRALAILGGHFLDVLRGLPTLRVFGRAGAQEEAIARVAEQHRRATMSALRVAFLSSLVLELAATVSTALVAVAIGLRLAQGGMALETGLAVLVLTPEVYLPLRRLGTQFHAAMDALAPAERLFELLDTAPVTAAGGSVPDLARDTIRLERVTVTRPGRGPVLAGADLVVRPGEHVALVGPSGAGKTTLLEVLLGFVSPERGRVTIGGRPLSDLSLAALRAQIGWVPQRPHLFAGTIADNVRFGDADASPAALARAVALAGLDLPLETPVGEGGGALSAGQRQRVALARALVRRAPLLLLDEPTANLDPAAQAELGRWLRGQCDVTVILAVHSPLLAASADRVAELRDGAILGGAA
jgi:thiol reductant ABC exporter CydD subunit